MAAANTTTLIALTGPAGAGKDAFAWRLVSTYGFARFAFADPVREAALTVMRAADIDHAYLTERHLKEQPLPGLGFSARRLLQVLGTECGRSLDHDIWVRIMRLRLGLHTAQPVHDRIVVTDVRYPNEARAVREWGAHLVGISRSRVSAVEPHSSETHYADLMAGADTLVVNDGSVRQLHHMADGLADSLGLDQRPSNTLWEELNHA